MQQLEDALNIGLCGHFLILLAILCMAAFSIVAVQYKKFCKLIHFEHYYLALYCDTQYNIHVYQPAAFVIRVKHLSVIFRVNAGLGPT